MKILVLGWYSHLNVGDDLFVDAFKKLFPQFSFTFTDHITNNHLHNIDAVFIGGGSILNEKPNIEDISKLSFIPLFYIGIGSETTIHPIHQQLLSQAKLIALRSNHKLSHIKNINPNTITIPDLAYALTFNADPNPMPKSILVLPNIAVIPQNNDENWKHAAWMWFQNEFSQFLDHLIDNDYNVSFLSMCKDHKLNDDFASLNILGAMKHRNIDRIITTNDVLKTISEHSIIITQRYHGIILSEIARTPYIAIHHHDKLKQSYFNVGKFIPYFGFSKHNINDALHSIENNNIDIDTSIFNTAFDTLVNKVNELLIPIRYAKVKNNNIQAISNRPFNSSITVPNELGNVSSNDLIINYKVKNNTFKNKNNKIPLNELRVAFITNWREHCGIARYGELIYDQLVSNVGDIKVFAEYINDSKEENNVIRCWKRGDDMMELVERIKEYDPDVVLLNHEWGLYFDAKHWLTLMSQLSEYRVIVIMHSVFHHKDKTICEAAMPEIIVHLEGAKKVLKEEKGISGKVYVIPHGSSPCVSGKLWNMYKTDRTFLQSGYGHRYKNYEASIRAVSILKKKYDDVFFTGIFSESDHNKLDYQNVLQ